MTVMLRKFLQQCAISLAVMPAKKPEIGFFGATPQKARKVTAS
jgi:hypothetical protein